MAKAHTRIDDGLTRKPKINRKPRARDEDGRLLPVHTPEKRQEVITDAVEALRCGETTDEIGKRHGVSGRTVRYWLLGDERAEQARGFMIAAELARTLEDLKEAKYADSPLPLACAREEFRAWSWIAERREARLYGQKQEVNVTGTVQVSHALQAISERRQGQITANDAPQLPQSVIDVEAERMGNDDTHQ